jgi:hypothetical protein
MRASSTLAMYISQSKTNQVLMSMLPHKDFINKDMRYLFWDPK